MTLEERVEIRSKPNICHFPSLSPWQRTKLSQGFLPFQAVTLQWVKYITTSIAPPSSLLLQEEPFLEIFPKTVLCNVVPTPWSSEDSTENIYPCLYVCQSTGCFLCHRLSPLIQSKLSTSLLYCVSYFSRLLAGHLLCFGTKQYANTLPMSLLLGMQSTGKYTLIGRVKDAMQEQVAMTEHPIEAT